MTALHVVAERDPRAFDNANCRGVDVALFYPERGESPAEAKAVCAGCSVRDACLDYALEHGERFGVWAGTSENERRRLRKERRIARAAGEAA